MSHIEGFSYRPRAVHGDGGSFVGDGCSPCTVTTLPPDVNIRSATHNPVGRYFEVVKAAVPLAKRRAARQPWGAGRTGLPGQQIDE